MTREEREEVIQHFKSLRILQRESFMREGFDVAIKALEQEPRWIPVSERLPEDYETVIASVGHEYVYPEARYSKEFGWEWDAESCADYWTDLKGVDAWMPLPKAYKPESEDKE